MKANKLTVDSIVELFFELYDTYDDIDLNPILEKYISEEVMLNHELDYADIFKTLSQEDAEKLLNELTNYDHDAE